MIVDLAVIRIRAAKKGIMKVLLLKSRAIASAAQLEGGAGSFVETNVEKEFGHWKNPGSEGQLCPEADPGSASGEACVIRAAVALD